jgi:hypothetical protein
VASEEETPETLPNSFDSVRCSVVMCDKNLACFLVAYTLNFCPFDGRDYECEPIYFVKFVMKIVQMPVGDGVLGSRLSSGSPIDTSQTYL